MTTVRWAIIYRLFRQCPLFSVGGLLKGDRLLVKLDVLGGTFPPRPVLVHAGLHDLLPAVRLVVTELQSATNRIIERLRIAIVNKKSCGGVVGECFGCAIDHGIGQTTGFRHDRYRTIPEAVQLIQPTWFIMAGHDKQIGTGFDAMSQLIAEADVKCEFAGVLGNQLA